MTSPAPKSTIGSASSTQLALLNSPADSETAGHTSAGLRVPKPKKTGNELVDDQNTALYHTTVELIDELIRDPSHDMPLWNKVQERKRKLIELGGSTEGSQFSTKATTIRKLVQEEPEWIILHLTSTSDLTPKQLALAAQADPDALEKLVTADTQLLPSVRMTPPMMFRKVLWLVFERLSKENGSRLARLGSRGLLAANGAIDWKTMNYKISFTEQRLSKVKHIPSLLEVDVEHLGVSRGGMQLSTPWSDKHAQLLRPPMAPTNLHTMFPKRAGPNEREDPNTGAVLKRIAAAQVEAEQKAKAISGEGVADKDASEFAKDLQDKKTAEKQLKMRRLREKAASDMETKMVKNQISLGS